MTGVETCTTAMSREQAHRCSLLVKASVALNHKVTLWNIRSCRKRNSVRFASLWWLSWGFSAPYNAKTPSRAMYNREAKLLKNNAIGPKSTTTLEDVKPSAKLPRVARA